MAFLPTVEPARATGLLKKIYDDAMARAGRVYQIVSLTSLNPRQTRAHLSLYASVMGPDSRLSPRVRESLAIVVSRANLCGY